ncbi:hypothetical protein COU74_02570 [Candidatus Peregrinibacteria bacterium CG10_big_fil_rev_8_21_14_0_10_36_19]|nr:MAG: hypothetical protein COU74_02570 [Candidatus Peregrinibacteria bacterium CG10_big_fil_rev_8_21_14_0_10_36_19]
MNKPSHEPNSPTLISHIALKVLTAAMALSGQSACSSDVQGSMITLASADTSGADGGNIDTSEASDTSETKPEALIEVPCAAFQAEVESALVKIDDQCETNYPETFQLDKANLIQAVQKQADKFTALLNSGKYNFKTVEASAESRRIVLTDSDGQEVDYSGISFLGGEMHSKEYYGSIDLFNGGLRLHFMRSFDDNGNIFYYFLKLIVSPELADEKYSCSEYGGPTSQYWMETSPDELYAPYPVTSKFIASKLAFGEVSENAKCGVAEMSLGCAGAEGSEAEATTVDLKCSPDMVILSNTHKINEGASKAVMAAILPMVKPIVNAGMEDAKLDWWPGFNMEVKY